jgi:hypothetical protein
MAGAGTQEAQEPRSHQRTILGSSYSRVPALSELGFRYDLRSEPRESRDLDRRELVLQHLLLRIELPLRFAELLVDL